MSSNDRPATGHSPEFIQARAEASIIGSVLADRSLMSDLGTISPDHFMVRSHRAAWRAMLDDNGIDDVFALQIAVPEISEAEAAVIEGSKHKRPTVDKARKILADARAKRDLKRILSESLKALEEDGVSASSLAYQTSVDLSGIAANGTISESATEVAKVLAKENKSVALPSGIRALDYVTYGGFHVGQLTALFARYKVGKTVMVSTIACNLERRAIPTLVISLERRKHDVERFIAARALNIDARDLDLASGSAHAAQFEEYLDGRRTLRYIHKPSISIEAMRAHIIAEVKAHGIKAVLVDYWQLITNPGSKGSQQEKQQESAQMLADLASDLDIPIIVTGQLNQEGQPRGGEGILASAGIIVYMHRPENAPEGFLEGVLSNKGPALSKGSPQEPSIVLAEEGPHFRDI